MDNVLLKKMVKQDRYAHFQRYFDGQLWYVILDQSKAEDGPQVGPAFPVPISDIGNATFGAVEKSILMMRYIRKHLQMLADAKVQENLVPLTYKCEKCNKDGCAGHLECEYCKGSGQIPALGYDVKGCFENCYKCDGAGVKI